MTTIYLSVIVVFLVLALLITWMEQTSGYLGDSSMVPGCLGIMVLVLAAITVWGFTVGRIVLSFN